VPHGEDVLLRRFLEGRRRLPGAPGGRGGPKLNTEADVFQLVQKAVQEGAVGVDMVGTSGRTTIRSPVIRGDTGDSSRRGDSEEALNLFNESKGKDRGTRQAVRLPEIRRGRSGRSPTHPRSRHSERTRRNHSFSFDEWESRSCGAGEQRGGVWHHWSGEDGKGPCFDPREGHLDAKLAPSLTWSKTRRRSSGLSSGHEHLHRTT